MRKLADGLWYWTARHPEWHPGEFGAEVASFALRAGAVAACMCVPPYPETQAYVAKILGLVGGAGDVPAAFVVKLVE